MKLIVLIILLAVSSVMAQSGRVKPPENPSPTPKPSQKAIKYNPTQRADEFPGPTPTPKTGGDDAGVIKIESTLVPIPVTVLDAGGRVLTNLRLEDFELKINGKPAELSDLSRSESPIRLAMLFDNSSSVLIARDFETKAAVRFFNRIIRPEKDLASLFSVSTTTRIEQRFTADVNSLTHAIEAFPSPVGATALLDGIILSADYLGEVQGRRVIVIVSDGDDTSSDSTLDQVLKSLQLSNCQVFVVKTTDFENYKRTGSRGGNANIRQLSAERRMIEIANQTGGKVYSPIDEKELDEAFRQISAELSQQYILSYYPENESENRGAFREISLSVKAKPNVDVRTRKGYYVPRK